MANQLSLVWTDDDGVKHTVGLAGAIKTLARFYQEWPGGWSEVEAEQDARRRAALPRPDIFVTDVGHAWSAKSNPGMVEGADVQGYYSREQMINLHPAALSWNGFNLHGDSKSIKEAVRLVHEAGTVPALKEMIAEERARADKKWPPPKAAADAFVLLDTHIKANVAGQGRLLLLAALDQLYLTGRKPNCSPEAMDYEDGFHDGFSNAKLRMAEQATTSPSLRWVSFEDCPPPSTAALDDPNVSTMDRVLVTNNVDARDRMGRPSHIWYGVPHEDEHGEWMLYDEGDRVIRDLTHWCALSPLRVWKVTGEPQDEL